MDEELQDFSHEHGLPVTHKAFWLFLLNISWLYPLLSISATITPCLDTAWLPNQPSWLPSSSPRIHSAWSIQSHPLNHRSDWVTIAPPCSPRPQDESQAALTWPTESFQLDPCAPLATPLFLSTHFIVLMLQLLISYARSCFQAFEHAVLLPGAPCPPLIPSQSWRPCSDTTYRYQDRTLNALYHHHLLSQQLD